MKVRIDNNVIRVRLNRLEVDEFNKKNRLVNQTKFGPENTLGYILEKNSDLDRINVSFDGRDITIKIPSKEVVDWAKNKDLIVLDIPSSNDNTVNVVIEKDLKRLSKHHKTDANAFSNPRSER